MKRADIPPNIAPFIENTELAANAYIKALAFILHDTARDPQFHENHLFAYLVDDLFQSAISIPLLAVEGLWSAARRELRFLLEASTKQAVIQQEAYSTSNYEKVIQYDQLLASSSISCKNRLNLYLIEDSLQPQFLEEVGRLYGEGSNYVHLSPKQVKDRMASVAAGHSMGYEGIDEARKASELAERTMAASIILLLHGVPRYVPGDLLVESDGSSRDWLFAASKFIASADSMFDYKHERKQILDEVRCIRQSRIRF